MGLCLPGQYPPHVAQAESRRIIDHPLILSNIRGLGGSVSRETRTHVRYSPGAIPLPHLLKFHPHHWHTSHKFHPTNRITTPFTRGGGIYIHPTKTPYITTYPYLLFGSLPIYIRFPIHLLTTNNRPYPKPHIYP